MPCPSPAHLRAIHGAGGTLSISQWSSRAEASPEDTHRTTRGHPEPQEPRSAPVVGSGASQGRNFVLIPRAVSVPSEEGRDVLTPQTHPRHTPGREEGSRGYREWQKEALLPKLLCPCSPLSSGCGFTPNDHFPPVTKTTSLRNFPVSGSLPGPAPSLQYSSAPFVAARCEGFSWKPEKGEFVGGTR